MTMQERSSGIDSVIELYDSDIKKITDGPIAWHNQWTHSPHSYDDHAKALIEQFHKIGLLAEVELWTFGVDGKPVEGSFMFQVVITGRIEEESGYDFDQMRHEIINNLLEIPGEGGVRKFTQAELGTELDRRKHKH